MVETGLRASSARRRQQDLVCKSARFGADFRREPARDVRHTFGADGQKPNTADVPIRKGVIADEPPAVASLDGIELICDGARIDAMKGPPRPGELSIESVWRRPVLRPTYRSGTAGVREDLAEGTSPRIRCGSRDRATGTLIARPRALRRYRRCL